MQCADGERVETRGVDVGEFFLKAFEHTLDLDLDEAAFGSSLAIHTGGGVAPIVAFTPSGGKERLGITGVAAAPGGFPIELNNGVFVSFHGSFYQSGTNNQLNPVFYYDANTGSYFDVISAGQSGLGNIDSLASNGQALVLADFSSGGVFQPETGTIYRLSVVWVCS